jgi:hypothetical protein
MSNYEDKRPLLCAYIIEKSSAKLRCNSDVHTKFTGRRSAREKPGMKSLDCINIIKTGNKNLGDKCIMLESFTTRCGPA